MNLSFMRILRVLRAALRFDVKPELIEAKAGRRLIVANSGGRGLPVDFS